MVKLFEHLMENKMMSLIKITFIVFTLLLSNIPLSSVAASDKTHETGSFYFDVESGQGEWQTDGLWHITTNRYNSPGHSFWYGDEITKTYNTGAANSGSLISPEITLPGNSQPVLGFWSWYQTEYSKDSDTKLVQISVNNDPWTDLLKITDARNTWNKESIDLSDYAGNTIRLRFLFDTVDNKLNNYEGWYVDDISLSLKESVLTPTSASASAPQPAPAQVLTCCYVAKNGNDNNPGTEQYPWLTITKAANTLVAGQTVYVKAGTYNEKITITKSGSPGNYITFAAYPGDNVTIDGSGISIPYWEGLVRTFGASYVKISGFRVMNSRFMGIMATSDYGSPAKLPAGVTIEKNYVTNTASSAIFVEDGRGIIIDGNEITKAQTMQGLSRQTHETITLTKADGFEIKNNKLYNNHFESIDAKEGSSNGKIHHNDISQHESAGIYVDAWDKASHGIEIFDNIIHDGSLSGARGIALAAETGGSLKNVKVYNNIVYNNAAIGIAIASYSTGPIDNATLSSNTVYNNGLVDAWGGGIVIEDKSATNVIIVNNIAYQNHARGNLITDNGGNSALFNNLVGINPIFVNAINHDFHLQSSSPAIDNGSSFNAPNVDFDGNSRPQGAGYDIGAYEFVPPPVPFDFSLSLNPSNGSVTQGENTSTTATATLTSGASQPVSFSCSGLPMRVSCSFNPSSLNPTASSTLIISTSSTTPAGIHPITVSGTNGSITRNATYSLNVIPVTPVPFNFSLSLSPPNGSVVQGNNISTTATATLISGASQPVSFSCSGLPSGASCSFKPSSLYPTNSSTLIISTLSSTPQGTYPIAVSGTNGSITRNATYSLEVTVVPPVPFNFSMSLSPSNGSVVQSENTSTTATATLISGASKPVSFSCSGLPSGASCSFKPSSLYPTNSSTLIISASASTPTGTYSITVSGAGGSITRNATYNLTVIPVSVPFDFSLSLSPSNGSVLQGNNISTTATATLISGASKPVSFSCSGLPSGASCSFKPSSLYPTNSSTLIISASASTPTGTYSIIISGVSSNITRTVNYALKVNTANPSIGEAVDNTALQWTTGGNATWFGQSSVYYYGNDSAQSGNIGDDQNTWVQTTVTGPGTLKFYWKVSSEQKSDTLNFYIDGSRRARISGNTSWAQKTYTLSSGTHTLKWMYSKNKAAIRGSDAGWLDKVVYTPRT